MAKAGVLISAFALVLPLAAGQTDSRSLVADRVRMLTRESAWRLTASVPVAFRTHHPQGMVKIGATIFVSSVEIKVPTRRFPQPIDGYDRDAGEGVGHLFKMDLTGKLLAHVRVGEGAMYHPGGIDFDGTHIWVSVAEYRPNSRSIVYRIRPDSMEATEVFRFDDHLGAIVRNTEDNTLHAVSWGSRRFYRWPLDATGGVTTDRAAPEKLRALNTAHYLDYQDCKYVGRRRMLCTGVTEIRHPGSAAPFRLGGIELVDLEELRPVHQVPVLLWTTGGLAMTQNPVWIEPGPTGLRAFFMPADDRSVLYIYEVDTSNASLPQPRVPQARGSNHRSGTYRRTNP